MVYLLLTVFEVDQTTYFNLYAKLSILQCLATTEINVLLQKCQRKEDFLFKPFIRPDEKPDIGRSLDDTNDITAVLCSFLVIQILYSLL